MTLFSAGKDSAKEQWDGARTSFTNAVSHFRMDDAQPISALVSALKRHSASASHVYMDVPHSLAVSRRGRSPSQTAIQKVTDSLPCMNAISSNTYSSHSFFRLLGSPHGQNTLRTYWSLFPAPNPSLWHLKSRS